LKVEKKKISAVLSGNYSFFVPAPMYIILDWQRLADWNGFNLCFHLGLEWFII